MRWAEIWAHLGELYGKFASWVYDHPIETDIAIVLGVVGSIWVILSWRRRARSRVYRIIRGELMKRKDREAAQRMKFEDAIVDAAMEMVQSGDMTPAQEKEWYEFFLGNYGFKGLAPLKNLDSVKRGIRMRLRLGWALKPVKIPGDKPGGKVDPTYKPVEVEIPERKGLETSKYV